MKRKVLCIKDFKSGDSLLFSKNQHYQVDYEDEYKIVMKYPFTEYQRLYIKIHGRTSFDNRVQFEKIKRIGNNFHYFDDYFSDRIAKLDKLSTISFD